MLAPETGSRATASSASYYVLDIAYIIVFLGSLFSRVFSGVTGLAFNTICGRDGCPRDFGCGGYENLSGAISWLTFFAGGAADVRRSQSVWRRKLAELTMSFSAKAEELSLFSPAGRQQRQAHQCLGGELPWFSAIYDGRSDVGRQPRKTQESIEVGCRHLLLASDIMHSQLGVMDRARLDVVRARNDSEQAGIGCRLIIGSASSCAAKAHV